jgi:hypothetical protein
MATWFGHSIPGGEWPIVADFGRSTRPIEVSSAYDHYRPKPAFLSNCLGR